MFSYDGFKPLPMERLWAKGTMQRFYALMKELATHAVSTCDPGAHANAMRFLPHLRFRLYRELHRDRTGRIGQVAHTQPGVVIFALGLMEGIWALEDSKQELRVAGRRTLDGIIAGEPLKRLLDEALEAWVAAVVAMPKDQLLPRGIKPTSTMWLQFADAGTSERLRLFNQMRLLVRRAGSQVPGSLLLLPPPIAFAPDDIPLKVRANARWYRLMRSNGALLAPLAGLEAEQHALGMFLSKHAPRLGKFSRRHRALTATFLHEYACQTGHLPTRRSALKPFVRVAGDWYLARLQEQELQDNPIDGTDSLASCHDVAEDVVFPVLPVRPHDRGGFSIAPIRTPAELRREGAELAHCVSQFTRQAATGTAHFYSVRGPGTRLTLQVRRRGESNLDLVELKGYRNRQPTPTELRMARDWINAAERDLTDEVPF